MNGDLISRSAVIKVLEECNLDRQLFEKDVFDKVEAISHIEAVPVVHGEWIKVKEWATKAKFRCSVCGREIMSGVNVNVEKYPYCHCGAKMDGGKE